MNASAINLCNIGEYLDYSDFKCKKKLVDPLVEECTKDIYETKLINITLAENKNNYEYSSCMVYIVLMIVAIAISTGITIYLVYYNWFLINNNNIYCIKFNNHEKNKNLMSTII